MAVDNPTYFSVAGPGSSSGGVPTTSSSQPRSLASFFRRKGDKMRSTTSASVAPTSTTSTNIASNAIQIIDRARSSSTLPDDQILAQNGGQSLQPGGTTPQRRSFKNFFRSVSANADPEKTQQFLNGDPRPSDVAPPSPYLPHRSHSHSENDRRRPGRKKILKSASELLSNDMVYCGLAGEDVVIGQSTADPGEEVFLGAEDARYYNVSATLPVPGSAAAGRRRHSIGTFLNKTNGSNQSVKKVIEPLRQPDTMAPPVPTVDDETTEPQPPQEAKVSRRRRHRSACGKGTAVMPFVTGEAAIDDVILVSSKESEVAVLWVNYLVSCFAHISQQQGRPPFKVQHVTVEETRTPEAEEKISAARLRIIVLCPSLLEYATSNPAQAASLSRHLVSDKVLAMMLGVDDTHITENHKAALVSYNEWRKFFVKDKDEDFVGDLMRAAVTVLGTSAYQTSKTDQTSFSILPKKVKMGQSRVIALLNDPLQPEDVVTVVVDRCGEAIVVSHMKKRNPYTLQFSIPDRCLEVSMLVGVRISKNGEALGVRQVKCESRLRELDQILRANDNPLEFMCQTLGFNSGDREQLDNWMVHAFQRNLPPHFNLLSSPAGTVPAHKNQTSPEETPTLLHFAARFGLEKLAWQLLDCPGGDLACDLRNVSELTPADLAEQAGHTKLAQTLRGYVQMNEFTNMYTYLKVMSESTSTPTPGNHTPIQDNEDEYSQPRALNDVYMVPPTARPLTSIVTHPSSCPSSSTVADSNMGDYAIAPAPTPVQIIPPPTSTSTNGLDLPFHGYMEMHPASFKTPATPTLSRSNFASGNSGTCETVTEQNRDESTPTPSLSGKSNFAKPREHAGPQDELLEIIHDFKNNVFTISEVEKLVDSWKKRNDVQQNFKEKDRQLMAMRDEYEIMQKLLREKMKRPTPFDRVRKLFGISKKDTKDTSSGEEIPIQNKNVTTNTRRPVSSLSLHSVSSSSSSGRMSMVSECSGTSLGDSGTHSDPEDRKRSSTDKEESIYYEVPPAPRPYPQRYSPVRCGPTSINSIGTNSLGRRPPQTAAKPSPEAFYMTCTPSGLPIHSFKADGTPREPKTPISPTDQPDYLDLPTRESTNGNLNAKPVFGNTVTPPPGMCIPTEYVSNQQQRQITREQPTFGQPEQGSISEKTVVGGDEEYVESDVVTEALTGDTGLSDTSDLPEYVNVEVPATTTLPSEVKKLPAPPIPPRVKTVR
ncbi:phosphoinositide 3-kinase adapter protein 1 isoform X1 [Neodiprion virginianus]|uniref:phosphoinositide 3-kinase adapter protein 1 isoform X1 n=1 Tax=Neodiprion virginianus TaxID=2961670 RepID=UPI001EE6FE03|nr:phosphoinositide 3-kinase adapter protein 1 isoform X1 [Neodiprion virginianus]XP_046611762.1 phosphoinositide 3-kinase adapter protein 1 isoform X1 [Neodiprion virginianus]